MCRSLGMDCRNPKDCATLFGVFAKTPWKLKNVLGVLYRKGGPLNRGDFGLPEMEAQKASIAMHTAYIKMKCIDLLYKDIRVNRTG